MDYETYNWLTNDLRTRKAELDQERALNCATKKYNKNAAVERAILEIDHTLIMLSTKFPEHSTQQLADLLAKVTRGRIGGK